jgi:hypothetical protein
LTVNGDNAATVTVGATYADLGATTIFRAGRSRTPNRQWADLDERSIHHTTRASQNPRPQDVEPSHHGSSPATRLSASGAEASSSAH